MYLEKLEIQGFKSFAGKNVLVFPGMLTRDQRGITAIVGPNGSGKSNIADAVRWALGEQSMKMLRGKKSEDIIFSGSDKKGRLGMAEVSLFLNNEDGQALIDYSQIVITRRLYRNGESEYLLNSNRVRLLDIQLLLAKAKFGQKTYSVIGQGIVEGFLNTSLMERKEFFDEATGIKQFQMKRDESLSKLLASYENLNQAKLLVAEIEPRLKSLTRQVNKLKKRDEIANQLKELQLNYYGKIWQEINEKFNQVNKKFLELEKIKQEKEKKLANFNHELLSLEKQDSGQLAFNNWQKELTSLQNQKELITKQLAKLEAQQELKLEVKGKFDLSWFSGKKNEIAKEITEIDEEMEMLEKNINLEKIRLKELEQEKNSLASQFNKLNSQLNESGYFADNQEVKQLNIHLKKLLASLEIVEKENDLIKIKSLIKSVVEEIKLLIKASSSLAEKENWQAKQQQLLDLTRAKEKISLKLYEGNFRVSARSERVKLIKERKIKLLQDLKNIENKLSRSQDHLNFEKLQTEENFLKAKITDLEIKIKLIKEKINAFSAQEEGKRNRLFTLQKNLQSLQNEINLLAGQLGELKISSTRYETKLEDLEIEIRGSYGNLKKIKEHQMSGQIDLELAQEKISLLKRQIDQIGGIDPEIEKEYLETRKRFDFLSNQIADLTKATGSLEKIIKELDLIIKEKFDREFKKISAKFEGYFKILFNGGNAKIIKVLVEELDEEEKPANENQNQSVELTKGKKSDSIFDLKKIKLLQKYNATGLAGIEIQATPPGKKIKLIAMLSGGERALTAIALICAIISSNPSPFVVLDEVDASLDEANSERFAKILDELSYKTQFIVITHNRATMRHANILYGVTMGDDGVSKLLSIKLDEAKIVAA